MTLTCEPDVDILKIYLHTKMNFSDEDFHKLEHYRQTDTQSDATENVTTSHYHAVVTMVHLAMQHTASRRMTEKQRSQYCLPHTDEFARCTQYERRFH